MTNISAAALANQKNARQGDGTFGTQTHAQGPELTVSGAGKAPTSGPEFYAALAAIEQSFHEGREKTQHGYMLRAINEMKERCPNVASFTLTCEDDLEAEDIVDVDGNEVSDADEAAMHRIWHYRDEDDYTHYIGEEIDVQEIRDTWQPGGEAPGEAPTSGPEFEAALDTIDIAADKAKDKTQHGYMLMAINEMQEQCPDVASFTLTCEDDLEAEDILDADGNEVSDADEAAMRGIWHYRAEADYTRYLNDETVDIQDIKDTWQP